VAQKGAVLVESRGLFGLAINVTAILIRGSSQALSLLQQASAERRAFQNCGFDE